VDLSSVQLTRLSNEADDAYRRARTAVYDVLEPGAPIDMDSLTPRQREAITNLHAAEGALSDYRSQLRGTETAAASIDVTGTIDLTGKDRRRTSAQRR
jgi:hypothetical protein